MQVFACLARELFNSSSCSGAKTITAVNTNVLAVQISWFSTAMFACAF